MPDFIWALGSRCSPVDLATTDSESLALATPCPT